MNRYFKIGLMPFLALVLVVGFVGTSVAAVNLDASAALVTVPAERTQKIGPLNDGECILNNAPITWIAGQNYAQGNRLKLTLPTAAGSRTTFAGTWFFQYSVGAGAVSTFLNNADGNPTLLAQLNTNVIVQSETIQILGSAAAADTALSVNVASVVGEQTLNLTGVLLTSGLGTVDTPDTDPLVQTLYQYSNSNNGVATATIDAINFAAQLFSGSTVISKSHAFVIDCGNQFAGSAPNAPTFAAGDQIQLTLTDNNYAFQGMSQVAFTGGGQQFTRNVTAATNVVFTLTANEVTKLAGAAVGRNNTDIGFNINLIASGTTALRPRTVSVSDVSLLLNTTGNGTRSLGNYGNAFYLPQNGTLYRANYFRYDAASSQNAYYKFSNDSGTAMKVQIRYHDRNATTAGTWSDYPTQIPAWGVLAINKQQVDNVLGLGVGNYNGWIEFRIAGNPIFITAVVNAKFNDTWFNIPIHLYDTDQAAGVVAPAKYR